MEYFPRTHNIAKIGSFSCPCPTIDWTTNGNYNQCVSKSEKVRDFAKICPLGHWSFLGSTEEENWYGTHNYKLEGQRDTTADVMAANFKDSGHPVFRAFQCVGLGILKRKGGRCTTHFSAEPSNVEILFSTIHFANQLSIYGAIADWCDELTQRIPGQSYLIPSRR